MRQSLMAHLDNGDVVKIAEIGDGMSGRAIWLSFDDVQIHINSRQSVIAVRDLLVRFLDTGDEQTATIA